ncbi:hypothetical protein GCM10011369_21250 [Neiella marina]|uniref:YqcC-like domain-containing protein n=2 Tax=Neiella marina TaxID=508461 RepID=A0A8J2U5I9_9GAMM|nr:hypothetical protein GCM10011369_21250 [Neiella marina]
MAELLQQLETELKNQNLWQTEQPNEQALASTLPFCVDTLSMAQWLQFVFLPIMQDLIEQRRELPEAIAISPMAEEVYRHELTQRAPLIQILRTIDVC